MFSHMAVFGAMNADLKQVGMNAGISCKKSSARIRALKARRSRSMEAE
jgi:hypothetical protein